MRLRLSPGSVQVLADWRENRSPSEDDQKLVTAVLETVVEQEPGERWHRRIDTSDDSITIYEPRPGLTVHVRLWTDDPGQFDVVRILDDPEF
jgi:hypothetical protein